MSYVLLVIREIQISEPTRTRMVSRADRPAASAGERDRSGFDLGVGCGGAFNARAGGLPRHVGVGDGERLQRAGAFMQCGRRGGWSAAVRGSCGDGRAAER